jgi:hypothetical protein
MTPEEFIRWEYHSQDTIDFKRVYVDITGDICAGLLLSQVMYWHLPSKEGKEKRWVEAEGKLWVLKKRHEWWNECRLTPKQFDRAANILHEKGLAEVKNFKYQGRNTKHIRLIMENVIKAIEGTWKKGQGSDTSQLGNVNSQEGNDTLPKGKCENPENPHQACESGDEKIQNTSEITSCINISNDKNYSPNINNQYEISSGIFSDAPLWNVSVSDPADRQIADELYQAQCSVDLLQTLMRRYWHIYSYGLTRSRINAAKNFKRAQFYSSRKAAGEKEIAEAHLMFHELPEAKKFLIRNFIAIEQTNGAELSLDQYLVDVMNEDINWLNYIFLQIKKSYKEVIPKKYSKYDKGSYRKKYRIPAETKENTMEKFRGLEDKSEGVKYIRHELRENDMSAVKSKKETVKLFIAEYILCDFPYRQWVKYGRPEGRVDETRKNTEMDQKLNKIYKDCGLDRNKDCDPGLDYDYEAGNLTEDELKAKLLAEVAA